MNAWMHVDPVHWRHKHFGGGVGQKFGKGARECLFGRKQKNKKQNKKKNNLLNEPEAGKKLGLDFFMLKSKF